MTVSTISTMHWRNIGPFRGGRVVAVAGDPRDRNTFYFGGVAGGVWKTTDGGTYWRNVSDGFIRTSSVGALAVADSDPSVLYAGMGEACIRSDVSAGDGVYRSNDSGKSWTHLGLEDTRHISRVRVHPKDPDLVYVAALGHAFGPNSERGVFRSKDGGRNWEQILFKSEDSGAIDLSMDPHNPRVLFAAIWQVRRTPWGLTSAGPESGLWRSTDGGDTWTDLTNRPGMPDGIKGRIGVAISPAQSGRVWAIVEAEDGVLLRSDDSGDTWERVNDSTIVRQRPFYHQHIFAHPTDPDTMWTLPIQAWRSDDAGRTFSMMTTPHSDNHDLWVDPADPRRMIGGHDGGACVSYDGGDTWSTIFNQPTSQFYHVATDTQFPYRVYGTQQDNTAISVPHRSHKGAIVPQDAYSVGSSESGYIAIRPDNPNIVYSGAVGSAPGGGGALLRYDHASEQVRIITVWPEMSYGLGAKDMKYRFQWTFPIVISPHDPGVLYAAANRVFRSTDEGTTWEPISPDLTRDDPTKGEPGGGPITRDVSGAEVYCTVFSFVESPHQAGLLWAGTDDGRVHISSNAGETWTEITPEGLPKWATISMIEQSPHDPNTAYLAAWNYKLDDNTAYLYRTTDLGLSWETITVGIPEGEFVRVVREDTVQRGLLYLGTESTVYVSHDAGDSWQSLQHDLPVSPIHDLVVKDFSLVVATHGRSFWILDDLAPLRQLTADTIRKSAHLFKPDPTYRLLPTIGAVASERVGPGKNYWTALGVGATFEEIPTPDGGFTRSFLDAGENPPEGVVVTYHLQDQPEQGATLTFLDADGDTIRCLEVSNESGMNRFVWNMRHEPAREAPGDDSERLIAGPGLDGPLVAPGTYSVRLDVEGESLTQSFDIPADPRVEAGDDDLAEQVSLQLRIRDKLSETHDAINSLRQVRRQVREWQSRGKATGETLRESGDAIASKLSAIEDRLIPTWSTTERGQMGRPLPKLVDALTTLTAVVASADAVPTRNSYAVLDVLSERIAEQTDALERIIDEDIPAFVEQIHELGVPSITPGP